MTLLGFLVQHVTQSQLITAYFHWQLLNAFNHARDARHAQRRMASNVKLGQVHRRTVIGWYYISRPFPERQQQQQQYRLGAWCIRGVNYRSNLLFERRYRAGG